MNFDIKEIGKTALTKLLWFLLMFLIIEFVLIGVIDVITIFLNNSISDISSDVITSQLAYTYQNPFTVIQNYINESNLLFMVGTIANAISCIVALFNRRKNKQKEWETQSEGYHGSAHWAKKSEILDNTNFTKTNKNAIGKAFNQSLQKENQR